MFRIQIVVALTVLSCGFRSPAQGVAGILDSNGILAITQYPGQRQLQRYSFDGTLTDAQVFGELAGTQTTGVAAVGGRVWVSQEVSIGSQPRSFVRQVVGPPLDPWIGRSFGFGLTPIQALGSDPDADLVVAYQNGQILGFRASDFGLATRPTFEVNSFTVQERGTGLDVSGDRFYLAQGSSGGNILVYDSTGAVVQTIVTGLGANTITGLAFDPATNTVWVSTFTDPLTGGSIRRYAVDGTLLSSFPTTGFITGIDLLPGPEMPTQILPEGGFLFLNVPSGHWFDPPSVDAFTYTMRSNSLFTSILDFPTGFDSTFNVLVNGNSLGTFGAGQSVDFVSRLGGGVSSFTISGIAPLVDSADPLGFPLRLAFDTPTASFSMTPVVRSESVPEPLSLTIWAVGITIALGGRSPRARVRRERFFLNDRRSR